MTALAAVANCELALQLAGRGWFVFPCRPDKRPYTQHGKDDASTDQAQIATWWARWPDALIGIYCEKSGFFALDIDRKEDRDGELTWRQLVETYGNAREVEAGPAQQTPSGGYHILFKLPIDLAIPNNANKLGPGLDLRSNGYICSGGPYQWLPGHDPDQRLVDAPAWMLDLIRNMGARPPAVTVGQGSSSSGNNFAGDNAAYWLQKALEKAAPGNRNETGFWLACQLRDAGASQSEAESAMRDYAQRVPGDGYSEAEALASLREAYKSPKREPARGLRLAGLNGNGHHAGGLQEQPPIGEPSADLGDSGQPEKIQLTDMGNARRFAQQHAGKVCYTKAWGWMVWTGKKWEHDETGRVMRLARETVKRLYRDAEQAIEKAKSAIRAAEAAADQGDENAIEAAKKTAKEAENLANALLGWAIKSQGGARLETMVKLAQSEPEISTRIDDFDKDPWLLNVQNGVLDLRTGELKPHDPRLKITKISGAAYDPSAICPTWLSFLDRIFEGNQTLIAFMQRAAGYSLTGDVREQALFFLYGTGANGKSTFTGALQDILGDYSMKIRSETLMVKRNDSIPEELAQLAGARFVLAAELGEGQVLNESLVKDLTGYTDKVRGRLLYQASFEFYPVAKPWLYGNHDPIIKGTDEGIWRRVKKIPFVVRIPKEQQDKELPSKLRAEMAGILTWCVQGCQEWQRAGLGLPAEIEQATAQLRADQDILGAFLDEKTVRNTLASVLAGDLYAEYAKWAKDAGIEHPMTSIAFSRAMSERGYSTRGPDGKPQRQPGSGKALYRGIGLLASENEQ